MIAHNYNQHSNDCWRFKILLKPVNVLMENRLGCLSGYQLKKYCCHPLYLYRLHFVYGMLQKIG